MENVILNRFANRSWLGTEVLIFSEVPEYGERLSERLNKLNPTQELRTHVFTKYNDAHDCAKKLKNLGILIFIESDSGTHPPQDIIRELLTPFETRGTPGVSLIFSEKELTVRGAIASKKANSCVDYLPYTITENSENLLKIF